MRLYPNESVVLKMAVMDGIKPLSAICHPVIKALNKYVDYAKERRYQINNRVRLSY